jgi:hypothetical protein
MAGSFEANQNESDSMSHAVNQSSLLENPSSSTMSSTNTSAVWTDDPELVQLEATDLFVLQHII